MAAALSRTNLLTAKMAVTIGGAGASADAGFPAADVLDGDPTLEAGWYYPAAAGTTYLQVDAGAILPTVNVIAALNVRLDAAAVTAFTLRTLNAASAVVDTWAFPIADCVPIPDTADRYNFYGIMPAARTTVRYAQAMVATNANPGYVRAGHIWVGPALVFPTGVDGNWTLRFIDGGESSRPANGGFIGAPLPNRAVLTCPVKARTYDEAMGKSGNAAFENMRNIIGSVGKSRPVLLIARDGNIHSVQTMSVYGTMVDVQDIGHESGDNYGSQFQVEQIR